MKKTVIAVVLAFGLLAAIDTPSFTNLSVSGSADIADAEISGTFRQTGTTATNIAEMSIIEDGAQITIDESGTWHLLFASSLWSTGDVENWTYSDGSTSTITVYEDRGGGVVRVTTSAAHGLVAGDVISITNSTNYNDVYHIVATPASTTFEINATWAGDDAAGRVLQSANLTAGTDAGGKYLLAWSGAMADNTGQLFDLAPYIEATRQTACTQRQLNAGGATKWENIGMVCIVTIADGDVVSFSVINNDGTAKPQFRNLSLVMKKL